GSTIGYCETCAGCVKFEGSSHPDLFFIQPDGTQIKIPQIRELQSKLIYHPLEANQKMVLIDDAHKMNEEAANALLKTLEEPPEFTHFILISAMPHRLLPTIRSRCRQIAFSPLKDEDVAKYLIKNCALEEKKASHIARLAGGSIGNAISFDPAFVSGVLERFTAVSNKSSTADILELSETWGKEDTDKTRFILDFLSVLHRDMMMYLITGKKTDLVNEEAVKGASFRSVERIDKNLDEIFAARASLEFNSNKQLMFENLLFTLTS
ncbi:MAG TPA: DNA polymerase III subunit delta', partial [bacterium]|nr:DNA polymerase III subunit delta' [bacterium]